MGIRQSINTKIKLILQKVLLKRGFKLLSKSDFSPNGLQPYLREFLQRQSNGILHIGAHIGQEAKLYNSLELPVYWIEADPDLYNKLLENLRDFPNQIAINALVSQECTETAVFYTSSNNGESSSIFPLAGNPYWKGLSNIGTQILPSKKLDCIFIGNKLAGYDYWVVDVQGAELKVLQGAIECLQFCHYLNLEVSQEVMYRGGALYNDLLIFLKGHGFYPIWKPKGVHEEIVFINSRF